MRKARFRAALNELEVHCVKMTIITIMFANVTPRRNDNNYSAQLAAADVSKGERKRYFRKQRRWNVPSQESAITVVLTTSF